MKKTNQKQLNKKLEAANHRIAAFFMLKVFIITDVRRIQLADLSFCSLNSTQNQQYSAAYLVRNSFAVYWEKEIG